MYAQLSNLCCRLKGGASVYKTTGQVVSMYDFVMRQSSLEIPAVVLYCHSAEGHFMDE